MNIQDWFPLGWTSLHSKGLSRVSANTTVENQQFFGTFFVLQVSHPYMTTGKTIALTRWTVAGKTMSLLFNMLSRLVMSFLPRCKCLNIMAAVTICSEIQFSSVQFSHSVVSQLFLWDPMNHSTPDLPVHHQLPGFTQTHVHWVSHVIQPSHSLLSHCLPSPNTSQHQGLFHWVSSPHGVAKVFGVSASGSVLPMNTQDWSPLGWTGWLSCSPGDSQQYSATPQFKSINFLVLRFLHSPTLTSVHDYWKNHSLD